jgi:hypothetical protein
MSEFKVSNALLKLSGIKGNLIYVKKKNFLSLRSSEALLIFTPAQL